MKRLMEFKNPFSRSTVAGTGISSDVYRRQEPGIKRGDPGFMMSRGELMLFASCPRRWIDGYEPGDTDATDWGSLVDAKLCRPEEFDEKFIVRPATYPATKTSSAVKSGECSVGDPVKWSGTATFCKDWKAQAEKAGKTIVTPEDNEACDEAVTKLLKDPIASNYIKSCVTQVMVVGRYHDRTTGISVPVKALLDLVPFKDCEFGYSLADFKTCRTAAPGPWAKAVFDRGYHAQAAFYTDLYVAATGEDRNTWYHILQENLFPWAVGRRLLSSEFVELGRIAYIGALKQYCQCLKDNVWPSWDDAGPKVLNGWGVCSPLPYMVSADSNQTSMPPPPEPRAADPDDVIP